MTHSSNALDDFFYQSATYYYIRLNTQGTYSLLNPCYLNRLAYQPEDLLGQAFTQTVYEEDQSHWQQCWHNYLNDPTKPLSITLRKLTNQGTLLWSHWEFQLCPPNASQEVLLHGLGYELPFAGEGSLTGIDTRKIVKALFDSTNNVKFLVAPDYRILFFNKKAYENALAFHQRKLAVGDNILDYAKDTENRVDKQFQQGFHQALRGEYTVTQAEINYRKDLSFWFQSEYYPVYENGTLMGVAITIIDITERKQHELRIEKQNQLLQEIVFIQSHKVRQPVASILGLVSLLNKQELSPENAQLVELLEVTAQKFDQVIHQVVEKITLLAQQDQPHGNQ